MTSALNELTNTQYKYILMLFPVTGQHFWFIFLHVLHLSLLGGIPVYAPVKLLRAGLEMGRGVLSFSDFRLWKGWQRSAQCYTGSQLNKHWLCMRTMTAVITYCKEKHLLLVASFYSSSAQQKSPTESRGQAFQYFQEGSHACKRLWEELIPVTMNLAYESCSP